MALVMVHIININININVIIDININIVYAYAQGNDGLRRPIGMVDSDYCRCKCFLMLSDTAPEGGPLGLVPGSHLWRAGAPPAEYLEGSAMGSLPGHVKCAVQAGGMILFE